MDPLFILAVGMAAILGGILVLRLNAFVALIAAAILVSLLAPGDPATRVTRVAEAFGRTAGTIGIVIALAAVIGRAMMDSGAADRIVAGFLRLLGRERGAHALTASGFVLSIPVFFDTVFYLLAPLAGSMYRQTGRHYLRYMMAIAAGAVATHTLVPPTPGPLAVAGLLDVDLGTMIVMGGLVAFPAAAVGLLFSVWVDMRMPVPLRSTATVAAENVVRTGRMPGLFLSLLPVVLPIALIAANTVAASLNTTPGAVPAWILSATATLGNANLALLLSAGIAVWIYRRACRPGREEVERVIESSLMGGGVIILITAAGGAFGAMLQAAQIGLRIQGLFAGDGGGPAWMFLILAFGVASLLKIAQGSSTVAMITTGGMLAAMVADGTTLPFHRVYVATAIASGSLVGSWMNDSGFWVFTKMGGMTEVEGLRSWTPLLAVVGVTAMALTLLLALLVPLV